jgi:hypothetical protein
MALKHKWLRNNQFIKLIFFGNYFYGICAVALAIEGSLQQGYPLNNILFYILAFCSTVLFYTKAYIMTEVSDDIANIRSMWYARNKTLMWRNQWTFMALFLISSGWFVVTYWENIWQMNWLEWSLIIAFPLASGLYYGVDSKYLGTYKLRNIGWLKPFIIGYTWAGLATIYPLLYYCIVHGTHYEVTLHGCFLFVKNFMYVTILCILFDIKDYAMDYNKQLKTVVVKLGLRRTIFYFIIPLCIVGLGSFITYALFQHFSTLKILINMIPFILIIIVAYSMYSRRSIFYYLVIIDGLMLVKAACGITSAIFF